VQSGTAAAGDRIGTYAIIDGQDKYSCVFLMAHLTSISQELIIEV
jgi:hypothetical protein